MFDEKTIKKRFGRNLRGLRMQRDLTQEQLAERINRLNLSDSLKSVVHSFQAKDWQFFAIFLNLNRLHFLVIE